MLPKKLHFERNWFKALLSPMTREILDSDSGQTSLIFKMTWKSQIFIFTDKNRQNKIVEFRRKGRFGWNWDIFDMEKSGEQLGALKWDVVGTAVKFGAESWEVTKPDGSKFLSLETEDDSAAKRIADQMSALLYNPTHNYLVKNEKGEEVARIFAKHGMWKHYYDWDLLGGTDAEQKMALALFAALTIFLKK